ncbi:MAG: succinylglutamate desuccinylase/aspartoacylase family protein [Chloroflexota bacterium]
MNIGTIEAKPGEKAFGFFKTGETHGGFDVHIPLHIVRGATDGPVLAVHSGLSGLEIEPALSLPQIIQALDPAQMKGTLVLVPLMNTSGFEFTQVHTVWDDKNLNELGRGDADGTISEQMIAQYYQKVIAAADAVLEIHSGSQWSFHQYAGVYTSGKQTESRQMAAALGLPHVLIGQPADRSMACAAAEDGKTVVSAFIGGGPGLRDYRDDIAKLVNNAVFNGMRHLGMLEGSIESDFSQTAVIEAHTIFKPNTTRGFTFIDSSKRGQAVKAGEQIGIIRHPFTGETVEEIKATQDGIMLHTGASWPVVPEGEILAILGGLVEEIPI